MHKSIKINEHIYSYIWQGMGNNCNTVFFPKILNNHKSHLIIDPGHTKNEFNINCFQSLVQAIQADGFDIEDTGMIINTHSHADHCQSCDILSKNGSMQIAMSEEEEKFRHTGNKLLNSMFGIVSPEFKTTTFLKEGLLQINNYMFNIMICPGHSPGSVCLYLPQDKILITGDVVFYGSVGRTDFPGGNTEQLKESIKKLSQLEIEILIPGHSTELGNIIEGKVNIERNFRIILDYYF